MSFMMQDHEPQQGLPRKHEKLTTSQGVTDNVYLCLVCTKICECRQTHHTITEYMYTAFYHQHVYLSNLCENNLYDLIFLCMCVCVCVCVCLHV